MASRNPGIKKTLKLLMDKVETLENQSFAQKLAIDELENKLQQAEALIKQVQENPFGNITASVPGTPVYYPASATHSCTAGMCDTFGNSYCTICGVNMGNVTYITTTKAEMVWTNSDGTRMVEEL